MIHFKDNKNKSALSTRWAQMSKQEQIIEKKKIEIQAKLEAQKQAAALAAHAKLSNPESAKEDKASTNIFSNDGSFLSQYQALLEKQKKEKKEKEEQEKKHEDEKKVVKSEAKPKKQELPPDNETEEFEMEMFNQGRDDRRKSLDRGPRDRRRWNERGRNRGHSPMTAVVEDTNRNMEKNIPPLMQIPIMAPDNVPEPSQWDGNQLDSDDEQDSDNEHNMTGPGAMGPRPMWDSNSGNNGGPGPNMGLPNMGPPHMRPPNMGPPGMGPPNMGPPGMGPPNMGPIPGAMGPGPLMGPRPNMPLMPPGGPNMPPCRPNMPPGGPNMPPINPNMPLMAPGGPNMPPGGPNMPPGGPNMPPGGPNMPPGGPNMPPGGPNMPIAAGGPNMPMPPGGPNMPIPPMRPGGPNMPPMRPGGPNMPPMGPPFMGPPNFPMPPNWGPNGPGPCGPGPMPPMCGPNMGPNGPMPPFFGPPFPMGPNGPPNPMMPPNNGNMPFMPRPPFGPNFGNGNGPPNMPRFMPPGMPPNMQRPSNPDQKSLEPPDSRKSQNNPPPMPMKPKDMNSGNMQPQSSSQDSPAVRRAATEVANNGDHWESVLKAIQDQSLWFLHNQNSNEYKAYKELVTKLRSEKKMEIKPEDKYEPEFCMDDDSNEEKSDFKTDDYSNFNWSQQNSDMKREASSQSDEESDSRRDHNRRKKKSRWSDEPPMADIKPPGVIAPLPAVGSAGPTLAKIKEEGFKLTLLNRKSQALMQYAMTNYGTTNLSDEDWKKCEDNFKLNLLYQDMLKKRQEVERLAAAGRHKYEYDSDEDTTDGTWEHRLRLKEMSATEKWADELTKQAAGKHHIGDFLPPEELKKFMEKYSAVKTGKEPDLSDYKEFKLKEDNVGFKMLQKLGWSEGEGLGAEGTGIVEPINKGNQPVANMGLGASASDIVSPDDDEFDAYRKRMMLAYRFRPNPLNNPRRPYY